MGLLLPPDRGPALWHAPRVELVGVPASRGWPSPASLLAACRAAPGVPVTTHDIEADCVALQATGLFARVRPKTTMPPLSAGPQFLRRRQAAGTPAAAAAAAASALQPAAPLGRVRYVASPRELPPLAGLAVRLDSALVEAGWSLAGGRAVEAAAAAVVADGRARAAAGEAGATVGALVAALPALRALARRPPAPGGGAAAAGSLADVSVSYAGLETGAVEAVLRPPAAAAAAAAADPAVLKPRGAGAPETGLEASAEGGEGPGVEPFTPYRGPLPLTATMRVENLAAVLDVDLAPMDAVVAGGGPPSASRPRVFAGRWPPPAGAKPAGGEGGDREGGAASATGAAAAEEEEDLPDTPDGEEAAEDDPTALPDPPALLGAAAQLLTSEYARRQSAAGAKAGVVEGAAWRAALEAADEGGVTAAVLLGDVPARLTATRLARGVLAAAPLAASAVAGLAAAAAWAATHGLAPPGSEPALAGGVAAAAAAAAWPFLGPLVEVGRLAGRSGPQVEAAVAPPLPLAQQGTSPLRLWGEDAIVSWPGAAAPVIADRDAYMAASLWAAAAGGPAGGPAYVADQVDDGCGGGTRTVWRYAGPAPAPPPSAASPSPPWPPRAAPARAGEGPYTPPPAPRAVLAVVGSAHVPGMQAAWARFKEGGGVGAAVSAAAAVLERE